MNAVYNPVALITEKYGFITRSRGYFQYTQKGVRLADLWLDGGRAILGWNTGDAKKLFKNELERTSAGCFETMHDSRLERALKPLFPAACFSLYSSPVSLCRAVTDHLKAGGIPVWEPDAVLPGRYRYEQGIYGWLAQNGVPVWRPWLESDNSASCGVSGAPLQVMIPPFPGGSLYILACAESAPYAVSASDSISSGLLAALTRSVYDLRARLPERGEGDWSVFDAYTFPYWNRRGPYLYPAIPREKYLDFFGHCLDNKIIVSPDYDVPSIVPCGIPAGNFGMLRNNPFC